MYLFETRRVLRGGLLVAVGVESVEVVVGAGMKRAIQAGARAALVFEANERGGEVGPRVGRNRW